MQARLCSKVYRVRLPCRLMVCSHCPTRTQTPRLIQSLQCPVGICDGVCPCAVWTPPHNSITHVYRMQMKVRKGNVFTSVCQEFCPQGVYPSMHWGRHPSWSDTPWSDTPWSDTPPGQTLPSDQTAPLVRHPPRLPLQHPTGMHSCLSVSMSVSVLGSVNTPLVTSRTNWLLLGLYNANCQIVHSGISVVTPWVLQTDFLLYLDLTMILYYTSLIYHCTQWYISCQISPYLIKMSCDLLSQILGDFMIYPVMRILFI